MKYKFLTFLLLIFFYNFGQNRNNCSDDPFYNDPAIYYPVGNNGTEETIGSGINRPDGWNYMCDKFHGYMDGSNGQPQQVFSKSGMLPHWQQIYFDGFEVFDKGFWYPLPWNNLPGGDTGNNPLAAFSAENNTVNNGVLEQRYTYDPAKTVTAVYADGLTPMGGTSTADFWCAAVMSKLFIPINSRIQGNIKVFGGNKYTWPSFWLMSASTNALEIDIVEINDASAETNDDTNPEQWLKATMHNTQYDVPKTTDESVKQEGLWYKPNNIPSDGFHLYDLIWDQYKIQWWYDSEPYYTNNRFYRTTAGKSDNWYQKHWRENHVTTPSELILSDDDNDYAYFINQYFPSNHNFSGQLLISSGINKDINLNQGSTEFNDFLPMIPNLKQETDFFQFWIRADCMNGQNVVNELTYFYGESVYDQTAYKTGYSIYVPPTADITLGTTIGGPTRHAIFAATNDIEIDGEFEVVPGNFFLAHITPCTAAWDAQRTINIDSLMLADSLGYAADSLNLDRDSLFTQRVMSTSFEEFNKENSFVGISVRYNTALIASANEKIVGVEVLDLSGKILYSENNIFANSYFLDKKDLFATGLYLIRVHGTQSVHLQKIWLTNE